MSLTKEQLLFFGHDLLQLLMYNQKKIFHMKTSSLFVMKARLSDGRDENKEGRPMWLLQDS
jgi:hypothetical protein